MQPRDASEISYEERLALDPLGPGQWRSSFSEPNQNGRSYGGHLLGLAMEAALREAPLERSPSAMQFLFQRGALPDRPLDLAVTRLQEGKRLSSLQVTAAQSARNIFTAQVSLAACIEGPGLSHPTPAPCGEDPDRLPSFAQAPREFLDSVALLGGYGRGCEPAVEQRIPDPMGQLYGLRAGARFRHWLRIPQPMQSTDRVHFAALAYLSDWWMNFCMWIPQLQRAEERRIFVASLNHAMWFHHPPRADQWIHTETSCAHADAGRGLVIAQFHDLNGYHLATAMQECLTTHYN